MKNCDIFIALTFHPIFVVFFLNVFIIFFRTPNIANEIMTEILIVGQIIEIGIHR